MSLSNLDLWETEQMVKARGTDILRKGLLLIVDSCVVGLLGFALWSFLVYWRDYMSSRLEKTFGEICLSWDALNPVAYAHQGPQAFVLFVCLVVLYLSWRGYFSPSRTWPHRSPNVSQSQVVASSSGTQTVKKHRLRKATGVICIVEGSLSLLMALLCWMALPLVNSPLNASAALLLAISGVVAIVGGRCDLQGKNWGAALAGAIGTTVGLWPLGLLALVFTILSRHGFEMGQPLGRNA